jgi:hypothetical protein
MDRTRAEADDLVHYMVKPMSIEEMDRTVEAIKEIVLKRQ